MKLIVGLGNPGPEYSLTRHNAGRLAVEFIAQTQGLRWAKKKSLQASLTSFDWEGVEVMLARPETFMNVSGQAVSHLVRYYQVEPAADLLVVVDDAALPFGRLRLRLSGSDGGHNGLKSIDDALARAAYARLRIGIGGPETDPALEMKDYVLSPFLSEEKDALTSVLEKVFEACRLWARGPVADAMTRVNAAPK